jgi:hypothetical protein
MLETWEAEAEEYELAEEEMAEDEQLEEEAGEENTDAGETGKDGKTTDEDEAEQEDTTNGGQAKGRTPREQMTMGAFSGVDNIFLALPDDRDGDQNMGSPETED